MLTNIILFILTLLPILIAVAYIILAERKVMASIQRRRGPNVVGFFGLVQPFIDAVKLLTKEHIFPNKANYWLFIISPLFTLTIALISWSFIPFNYTNFYYDYTYSLLFLLTFSSLGVYGIVLSGWASNSKYALLGAIRTIAQFISYELILTIAVFPIILITQSLNFIEIVLYQSQNTWFILPLWPFAYIFFIASLAETNRTPFDLPEAEAELVAGYNVEYSSVFFILFMFAEYSNIMLMSALFSILFLGGWDGGLFFINDLIPGELIFAFKITLLSFCFIVVRATQPRLRFDQLLTLCWKRLLPVTFSLFLGTLFFYLFFCYVSNLLLVINGLLIIDLVELIVLIILATYTFIFKLSSENRIKKIFIYLGIFFILSFLDTIVEVFILYYLNIWNLFLVFDAFEFIILFYFLLFFDRLPVIKGSILFDFLKWLFFDFFKDFLFFLVLIIAVNISYKNSFFLTVLYLEFLLELYIFINLGVEYLKNSESFLFNFTLSFWFSLLFLLDIDAIILIVHLI